MPDPIVLCVFAVGAAVVAALAGHLANPARRDRRRRAAEQLRRAQDREQARNRVAGEQAVDPTAWPRFCWDHKIDDILRGAS